jgi:hypothetical protein
VAKARVARDERGKDQPDVKGLENDDATDEGRQVKETFKERIEELSDLEGAIRELKAGRHGEIEVAGPGLAQSLTTLG